MPCEPDDSPNCRSRRLERLTFRLGDHNGRRAVKAAVSDTHDLVALACPLSSDGQDPVTYSEYYLLALRTDPCDAFRHRIPSNQYAGRKSPPFRMALHRSGRANGLNLAVLRSFFA